MSEITLGIIGGGQLGSMLAIAAKKLDIKTIVLCDDIDAPVQNFCNKFIYNFIKIFRCFSHIINDKSISNFIIPEFYFHNT